ncbi:holo-ACP synthase [Microaerobacter geothermalis]|uniref:holo-ACP synthase n=1 Tax=Microaerobacter geothermalis TaxID=674972 RepID=UPI001F3A5D88|nr:holo-ACP synthase [Microaerobacter geothermalis]MCF6093763.1 holo-ACP synthase [Microaerobacter geothermalis]
MIIGIGIDLVEISRIKKIIENQGRFIYRIFTPREIALFPSNGLRRIEYISGRFAAKEAFSKAAGTGIGRRCSWKDIEIIPDDSGKPYLWLSQEMIQKLSFTSRMKIHLSISHGKQYAIAQVILEDS